VKKREERRGRKTKNGCVNKRNSKGMKIEVGTFMQQMNRLLIEISINIVLSAEIIIAVENKHR
jgi:hypothetical protein